MNNSDIYIDLNNTNIILNGSGIISFSKSNDVCNDKIMPYLIDNYIYNKDEIINNLNKIKDLNNTNIQESYIYIKNIILDSNHTHINNILKEKDTKFKTHLDFLDKLPDNISFNVWNNILCDIASIYNTYIDDIKEQNKDIQEFLSKFNIVDANLQEYLFNISVTGKIDPKLIKILNNLNNLNNNFKFKTDEQYNIYTKLVYYMNTYVDSNNNNNYEENDNNEITSKIVTDIESIQSNKKELNEINKFITSEIDLNKDKSKIHSNKDISERLKKIIEININNNNNNNNIIPVLMPINNQIIQKLNETKQELLKNINNNNYTFIEKKDIFYKIINKLIIEINEIKKIIGFNKINIEKFENALKIINTKIIQTLTPNNKKSINIFTYILIIVNLYLDILINYYSNLNENITNNKYIKYKNKYIEIKKKYNLII